MTPEEYQQWLIETEHLAVEKVEQTRKKRQDFLTALNAEIRNNPVTKAAWLINLADQGYFGSLACVQRQEGA